MGEPFRDTGSSGTGGRELTESTTADAKRLAGEAAAGEVRSGMRLGLGTGSTVRHFLLALGRKRDAGELKDVRGVPTSVDTEHLCREMGLPLMELPEEGGLDLAVDGADEVSPDLDLIKGLGGALLREKIVAAAARRFVVIVDEEKLVSGLGVRSPLPVEVAPFGWRTHLGFFRALGAEPEPREGAGGKLYVTDNGNHVIDLRFPGGIEDPHGLEGNLRGRSGVVETGLFLGMAHRVLVGGDEGVRALEREGGKG